MLSFNHNFFMTSLPAVIDKKDVIVAPWLQASMANSETSTQDLKHHSFCCVAAHLAQLISNCEYIVSFKKKGVGPGWKLLSLQTNNRKIIMLIHYGGICPFLVRWPKHDIRQAFHGKQFCSALTDIVLHFLVLGATVKH